MRGQFPPARLALVVLSAALQAAVANEAAHKLVDA